MAKSDGGSFGQGISHALVKDIAQIPLALSASAGLDAQLAAHGLQFARARDARQRDLVKHGQRLGFTSLPEVDLGAQHARFQAHVPIGIALLMRVEQIQRSTGIVGAVPRLND